MFKYVIFDYNGTLVDDATIGHQACNHLLRFYKLPAISLQRFRDTFTTPWMDFYFANGVKPEWIKLDAHQREYQTIHTSLLKKELRLAEGVSETLAELKKRNIIIGVLSSRNIQDLTRELKLLGIYSLFDVVVGEPDISKDGNQSRKKADVVIEKLNIADPSSVLYVGDMTFDIKTARDNGFASGVVFGGWQSRERLLNAKPDYVLEKFSDVLKIV
jgi:phosphoglycolate phosphatase